MTLRLRAWSLALTSVLALLTGCGATFRPIATPIISGGGDPQARRHAIVLSRGSNATDGVTTHVNISGDTNAGQVPLGQDPVHVALGGGSVTTYVANRASASGKPSLTIYSTFAQPTSSDQPLTTTLPDNSAPVYVFPTFSQIYVALSGTNTVGVVLQGQNVLNTQVPVGTTPVAITGLSDGTKVFVVNQGSNNVSVLKPDNTVSSTIPVGGSPVYAVVSSDNAGVYVVNRGSDSVTVIDSLSETAIATIPVGSAPNFAVFDARNLRVYVTNSGGSTISVINADRNSPNYLTVQSFPVGNNPVSLAVLADGSRVYVANSGSNSISVLSALSNAVQATLNLNGLSPVWLAASADSSKVEVAAQDTVALSSTHADASAILSIKTSDNSITAIPAPFADPTCTDPVPTTTKQCARLRPSFVVVTP